MAILTPGHSDIPTMDMSALNAYVHFVFEYTSKIVCDQGTTSYSIFAKWDLESAIFIPRPSKVPPTGISNATAHAHFVFGDSSIAGCDLLLLRIAHSQNGTSNRRIRNAGTKAPALSTFAENLDPSLVLGDLSQARFGGGPPSIASSQIGTLDSANTQFWVKCTRIKYLCREA